MITTRIPEDRNVDIQIDIPAEEVVASVYQAGTEHGIMKASLVFQKLIDDATFYHAVQVAYPQDGGDDLAQILKTMREYVNEYIEAKCA